MIFFDVGKKSWNEMTDEERAQETDEVETWNATLLDGLIGDDRYQHQSWLVRFWRRRHYLPIPFVAFRIWRSERTRELSDEHDWRMSFEQCWGLGCGLAQCKMKWYFTSEEIGYPGGFAQYTNEDSVLSEKDNCEIE